MAFDLVGIQGKLCMHFLCRGVLEHSQVCQRSPTFADAAGTTAIPTPLPSPPPPPPPPLLPLLAGWPVLAMQISENCGPGREMDGHVTLSLS